MPVSGDFTQGEVRKAARWLTLSNLGEQRVRGAGRMPSFRSRQIWNTRIESGYKGQPLSPSLVIITDRQCSITSDRIQIPFSVHILPSSIKQSKCIPRSPPLFFPFSLLRPRFPKVVLSRTLARLLSLIAPIPAMAALKALFQLAPLQTRR